MSLLMRTESFPRVELSRGMNKLFADLFEGPCQTHLPAANIWEEDEAIYLEMELPGVDADRIDMSLHGNELTIKVEEVQTKEEQKEEPKFLRRERTEISFVRKFRVPDNIDRDKVDADLKNGILTLMLPKVPESQPKRIEVKHSE